MTIKELIDTGNDYLKETIYGRLESEVILAHVLKKERVYLHININEDVSSLNEKRYIEEIKNLKNGKPLQYITGKEEWQGLEFFCNENTLIPREDTRILLEETIKLIEKINKEQEAITVIEIGTGSGILPTLLKKKYPSLDIYTVEKNPETLKIAKNNFNNHNVMVEAFSGDLLEPIKENGIKGDILISNPPYVSLKEYEELDIWVKNEPYDALVGGFDGLDFYRRIAEDCRNVLNDLGYVAVEIGWDQFLAVKDIFEKSGLSFIGKGIDDGGRDRVVIMEYRK